MIAPHRSSHRHTFAVLAILVPAVLAMGVAARHPQPPVSPQAHEGLARASAAGHFVLIIMHEGRFAVRTPVAIPDPLLYWTPYVPPDEGLPPGAHFIGPWAREHVYEPPSQFGYLILYSGAYGRIVDYVRVESQP
jgi:hypothetical protein